MIPKESNKIVIWGFVILIVCFMISSGILINTIFVRENSHYKILDDKIENLRKNSQSQINEITTNIIENKEEINNLNLRLGTINKEFNVLKASTSSDFSGIIDESTRSVVAVRTNIGQGTGFIITPNGYVVTNAHVIEGGKSINTITSEQKTLETQLIGYDSNLDIALLKIVGDYKSLELANSDEVQIGEKVIAIGNPLGLQFSASEGIVSGVHRIGINKLEAYIQTDAALNPGNSGGPLINTDGRVIGINNFKISSGENLGFALESNYIKKAVNSITLESINQTLI